MGRGKTVIKQNEVMRATRGLLDAAAAAGVTGEIEIHLQSGMIKLCEIRAGAGDARAEIDGEPNEWDSVQ